MAINSNIFKVLAFISKDVILHFVLQIYLNSLSLTHGLFQFSSAQFSRSVMSDCLPPHEPQHARPPCPSPTPGVHPNPCPSIRRSSEKGLNRAPEGLQPLSLSKSSEEKNRLAGQAYPGTAHFRGLSAHRALTHLWGIHPGERRPSW